MGRKRPEVAKTASRLSKFSFDTLLDLSFFSKINIGNNGRFNMQKILINTKLQSGGSANQCPK
jgi:hypothetical protein